MMCADNTHVTYAGDNADNFNLHPNQNKKKLTLNMTKTEFMLLGSRQRLSTLTESPGDTCNPFTGKGSPFDE